MIFETLGILAFIGVCKAFSKEDKPSDDADYSSWSHDDAGESSSTSNDDGGHY